MLTDSGHSATDDPGMEFLFESRDFSRPLRLPFDSFCSRQGRIEMADRVHILVLNYNGCALLQECLPSVIDCARAAAVPCRVSVVDNDSTDESIEFLRQAWPQVTVLSMPNRGLVSFNRAVRELEEPVVLLLNNDVKLGLGCVDRLAETFDRHADCFLAGPLCWTFDGRFEGTRSELRFRRGIVHTQLKPIVETEPVATEYTASAGAVFAVRRDKFLALGGFDPLFLPGRYEDLDLAFRGWLAGWKAYFVPEAVAYHKGQTTFAAKFGSRGIRELDIRNALLFAWKNLHESQHMARHLAFLAVRLAVALAMGQTVFLRGWSRALRRLSQVRSRRIVACPRIRSERELFALLG